MGTEHEWNGITRPVVRMGDGNFFFTPTVSSELASGELEVSVVTCQLLPARANSVKTSAFCCYA